MTMKKRMLWSRFFLAMTIVTAVAIFFFSSQSAEESSELSDGVTLTVAQVVKPNYAQLPPAPKQSFLESLSLIVRKCAHFSEFGLLGLNLMGFLCLRRWEQGRLTAALPAWGIATLYAGTDELHQMFSEQRGPALLDVGIDSAGALVGVLAMTLLLLWLARKWKAAA